MKIPELKFVSQGYDENVYCIVDEDGVVIDQWNDEAVIDYPEDLNLSRDIGALIRKMYEAGYKKGLSVKEKKMRNQMSNRPVMSMATNTDHLIELLYLHIDELETRCALLQSYIDDLVADNMEFDKVGDEK